MHLRGHLRRRDGALHEIQGFGRSSLVKPDDTEEMVHLRMVGIVGKEEPAAFPGSVVLPVLEQLKGLHDGVGYHRFRRSDGEGRKGLIRPIPWDM